MKAGDLIVMFADNLKIAVAIDHKYLVVIYDLKQIYYKSIEILLNIDDFSSIVSIEVLSNPFETCKTNVFETSRK